MICRGTCSRCCKTGTLSLDRIAVALETAARMPAKACADACLAAASHVRCHAEACEAKPRVKPPEIL